MDATPVAEKAMTKYPVGVYYIDHRNGDVITPAWVDVPLSEEGTSWSMAKDLGFMPAFSFPEEAVVCLCVWEQRWTTVDLPLRPVDAEAASAGSTQDYSSTHDYDFAAMLSWTAAMSGPIFIRGLGGLLGFLTRMAPMLKVMIAAEQARQHHAFGGDARRSRRPVKPYSVS